MFSFSLGTAVIPRRNKKQRLCEIWGGRANKVHCGKCGSGVWCFNQILCYAVSAEPFFPIFYEKIQEICSLFKQLLYWLLLVYIFKHDRNFTILGHSLNTREFILKCSATIRKVWLNSMLFLWPHSNCNQHVNIVHPLFLWATPVAWSSFPLFGQNQQHISLNSS